MGEPEGRGERQEVCGSSLIFPFNFAVNLNLLLRIVCLKKWSGVPSNSIWGLSPSAAVGIGFYGNSETNDGVYQLIYSLGNANHTFSGIDALVRLWAAGRGVLWGPGRVEGKAS